LIMAQRQMAFAHPFAVEFKQLAYEAVKRKERTRSRGRALRAGRLRGGGR
jgi:hypothetical protein